MLFKDREEAARKLLEKLQRDPQIIKNRRHLVVISLLRGGVVIGSILAKKLKVPHLPLVVAKISAPYNEELALGALCFDISYLEKNAVESLGLVKSVISPQIAIAARKFDSYCERFGIKEEIYSAIQNKNVIIVDDGIATGASVRAALLYLKTKKPAKIILAVPVAPTDFDSRGFDKVIILHRDPDFQSVSRFYQNFPQVEDEEVKQLLKSA